jgi:hypothetical protein
MCPTRRYVMTDPKPNMPDYPDVPVEEPDEDDSHESDRRSAIVFDDEE